MTSEDAQCSVILTTHSMEEAEALCSRIGVSKFKYLLPRLYAIRCFSSTAVHFAYPF